MNSAYIGKLMELAENDSRVIHLLADSGTGYDEMFRRNFPDQIINYGIAEENMVAAAAGMASCGKIPFAFTAGAFLAYRSMEFIRDDVCFQNLNVKLVGMGSGLAWSSLGPTHHTTEDISVLRAIPNLMILSPATPLQVQACVQKAYEHIGPVYIKTEMNHEKEFFEEGYALSKNGMDVINEGSDVAILVSGSILGEAYEVTKMLEADGLSVKLINVACIKPFDEKTVLELAKTVKCFVTIEEHNIRGGLGAIVSETLCYNGSVARVIPIGIEDSFAKGYGTHDQVRRANGLDAMLIYDKISNSLRSF